MKKTIYTKKYKYIIAQLKKARKDAGLKQNDVAKLLGMTQSHVSKIESGQIRLDPVQLGEFARIYHKRLPYFYPTF